MQTFMQMIFSVGKIKAMIQVPIRTCYVRFWAGMRSGNMMNLF